MAISEDIFLPAQPSSGLVEYLPLGGNGITSPRMMCYANLLLASDGSGGDNELNLFMDPAYIAVMAYCRVNHIGRIAAAAISLNAFPRNGGDTFALSISKTPDPDVAVSWAPAPFLFEAPDNVGTGNQALPKVRCRVANVDTESIRLNVALYLFDLNARERSPIELLFSPLVRGITFTD